MTIENMAEKAEKACCICGYRFTGWGNNPEPFDGAACCDDCNDRFVTPTRMCLGRAYDGKEILLLIQTIAELGKCFKRITAENVRKADDSDLPTHEDVKGILKNETREPF